MTVLRRGCRSCLAVYLVLSGCATPAVLREWRASDSVERVHFARTAVSGDEALLYWRVDSDGRRERGGHAEVDLGGSDCEVVEFALRGQTVGTVSETPWVSLAFDATAEPEPELLSPPPGRLCLVSIRPEVFFGNSDPSFELIHNERSLGFLETYAARENGWLALYPFALIADTAIVAPVVVLLVLPRLWLYGLDDFTWVPGSDPNFHREESDRKRKAREGDS